MKKIAMIKEGVVENISMWDMQEPWDPGPEWTLYDVTDYAQVQIGDTYNYATKEIIKKDEADNVVLVLEIPSKLIHLQNGLPV